MKNAFSTLLALAVLATAAPAAADDDRHDHDRARRAVQAGQVVPLRTVLDAVARDFPGDVVETELEDRHGAPIYEIKLISPEGQVMKLIYDASDGRLIKVKGRRP